MAVASVGVMNGGGGRLEADMDQYARALEERVVGLVEVCLRIRADTADPRAHHLMTSWISHLYSAGLPAATDPSHLRPWAGATGCREDNRGGDRGGGRVGQPDPQAAGGGKDSG